MFDPRPLTTECFLNVMVDFLFFIFFLNGVDCWPHGDILLPVHWSGALTGMSFKVLEHPEETHTDMGRTCKPNRKHLELNPGPSCCEATVPTTNPSLQSLYKKINCPCLMSSWCIYKMESTVEMFGQKIKESFSWTDAAELQLRLQAA